MLDIVIEIKHAKFQPFKASNIVTVVFQIEIIASLGQKMSSLSLNKNVKEKITTQINKKLKTY